MELLQIEESLNKHFMYAVKPKLTKKEIESVKRYSGTDSSSVKNFLLDTGNLKEIEKNYAYYLCGNIESAISKGKIPFDITLYHGGGADLFEVYNNVLYLSGHKLQKGDIFTSNIFLSTSLNKEVAKTFMQKEKTLLEISLKANTPALWLKPLSIIKFEDEVLLMDEIQFEVEEYSKEDDYHFIKVINRSQYE